MSTKSPSLRERIVRVLVSKWCWRVILGLFLLEALWFVFSAQYPMAFDENYHFGLIQLHARQWLPYFTSQPNDAGAYGAVARDPSYLYHWLMSYPYRLTTLFTHSQTAEIIVLRLLNVAMFAGGIVLYRRLVRRLGASPALTNSLFAVFVLIPVVPFLAATINYDNLFFLAVPFSALLALRFMDGLEQRRVDAGLLLGLIATWCLASLIKYPFLPVFGVAVLFLLWCLWRARLLGRAGLKSFAASFRALSWLRRIVLVLACVLAIGLFAERYAENAVSYHTPVPACNAVISQDECLEYGPYSRNYNDAQVKPSSFHVNIFSYVWQWLWGMWFRLFFAINYNYDTQEPLLVIAWTAVVCAVLLGVGIIVRFKALFGRQPARQFILWITIGYAAALFADNLSAYAQTGQPVAINGRYLVPFLPFVFVFGGIAWSQLLRRWQAAKVAVAVVVIAIFVLQGGGTMTFIVRSNDNWMWNNAAVRSVNRTVRRAASPLIIGKNVW
ncbi:MAG: hypothetical protein WDN27_06445 [Candidatus Saccharibacteria bacterium]